MGELRTLDRSATFSEMVDFIESCKGSVPRRHFSNPKKGGGYKRYIDIWWEFKGRKSKNEPPEITIYQDEETGYAVRECRNVKVFIWYGKKPHEKRMFLLEISKTDRKGEIVWKPAGISLDQCSASETLYLGEPWIDVLRRLFKTEFHMTDEEIDRLLIEWRTIELKRSALSIAIQPAEPLETVDFHKSSAFGGMRTRAITRWVDVYTTDLAPKFKLPRVKDNGIINNREWVEVIQSTSEANN